MSEADVVVIGGGHNGLAAATALGRSGLSVVVVEAEDRPGGMARTDDALGADHTHHPHATFLGYRTTMPLRDDLRRAGLRWVLPGVQHAIVFADGRPGVVIHRRDLRQRTHQSVARYSNADADLLVELITRAEKFTEFLEALLTSPPSREAAKTYVRAVERVYAGLPVLDRLGSRSVLGLIRDSFGSPEVRAFLLALAHELGGDVFEPGGDIGFLGVVCGMIGDRAVPVGGMGSVVAAYATLASAAGVEIRCGTRVERVLVADGNAVGVVSDHGERILARGLVVSTLPQERTLALLGDKTRALFGPGPIGETDVLKLHLLLRTPPRFASARQEPAVAEAVQTFFGWDDPEAIAQRLGEIRRGAFPGPGGALLRPALADPSQSVTPDRLCAIDSTFPDLTSLTGEERAGVQTGFPAATVRRLRDYAPNVTEDAVSASVLAPLRSAPRRIVVGATGHAHYRIAGVRRLYLAGTDRHPGSGVHGACGWNAASVAISDLTGSAQKDIVTW